METFNIDLKSWEDFGGWWGETQTQQTKAQTPQTAE